MWDSPRASRGVESTLFINTVYKIEILRLFLYLRYNHIDIRNPPRPAAVSRPNTAVRPLHLYRYRLSICWRGIWEGRLRVRRHPDYTPTPSTWTMYVQRKPWRSTAPRRGSTRYSGRVSRGHDGNFRVAFFVCTRDFIRSLAFALWSVVMLTMRHLVGYTHKVTVRVRYVVYMNKGLWMVLCVSPGLASI